MNVEFKGFRERKQSLNKLMQQKSCLGSTRERKQQRCKSSYSLQKRQEIISDISKQFIISWGTIPFAINQSSTSNKKIANNVMKFSVGQKHIVFINHKYQLFGIGQSFFGQLGFKGNLNNTNNNPIAILQHHIIHNVFCTPYCTFILTNKKQLYATGLNDRGQLGVRQDNNNNCPILVPGLSVGSSSYDCYQNIKRSSSKNKINSVYYQCNVLAERNMQDQVINEQQMYNIKHHNLLKDGETIIDIVGGPFHTVVLSILGRVFYTGNLYKSKSICHNEFIRQFNEISVQGLNRIIKVKAGLTSIGLLTSQGRLYVMGSIGQYLTFDEPMQINLPNIVDYDIDDKCMFICNNIGQVFMIDTTKKYLKPTLIHVKAEIKQIHCGLDYVIMKSKNNQYYGLGDNSYQQLSKNNNITYFNQVTILNYINQNNNNLIISLQCSNNFVVCLCQKSYNQYEKLNNNEQKLQNENKNIQNLLLNKKLKFLSCYSQTQKEIKFQYNQLIQCRTFDNSLEISFDQLIIGKQISQGGYGIIYKAIWRKTTVAVKIFKIDQNNDNSIRDFISQCHAMQALRHPNIVMFLGACTKPPNFCIVLEYCENGTLWSRLQKNGELSWQSRRNYALDTAKAMNYLHRKKIPILHRDLKSLNLLLDSNWKIKLADFGWTKGLQNYMTGKIGTYQWMAPQVVSAQQYTEKADVFSFGIILWQIASRQAPYRNIPGVQVAHDVLYKKLRPSLPVKATSQFIDLMQKCWHHNPSIRPSFQLIIQELENIKLE